MSSTTIPNWLQKRADITPERVAIIYKDQQWTFKELHKKSFEAAKKLSYLGVKKGDHVALLVSNSLRAVVIIHALEYIGATIVLLNTKLTSTELGWQVKDSDTSLLLFDKEYSEKITQIKNQSINVYSTIELENIKPNSVNAREVFPLDDTHTIIYTSGTTGKPKGVMLTYGNHWWSAVGSVLNLGLDTNDRWLCCLPIFHVSGLSILMRSIFYGITVVLQDSCHPHEINQSIKKHKVTIISAVSTILSKMLHELGTSRGYPDHVRCVLLGGGPAPKSLLEECKERKIPVYQTYGMTETASQIVTLSPEYALKKLGSAGKPLFPSQLKIMNEKQEMRSGEIGEIIVKGPNVTSGYYNRQKATLQSIQNGWLYTGDLGYKDDEGVLYVVDRRSDLIISGGENIYPAEIESVLHSHDKIEEAGVTGIEHEKWGKVPVAFIVQKNGKEISKHEIIDYCQKYLANYKVPHAIYFVDELPRNAANKLQRHKLLEFLEDKDVD